MVVGQPTRLSAELNMSSFRAKTSLALLAIVSIGCVPTNKTNVKPDQQKRIPSDIQEIVNNYSQLKLITPDSVNVNPDVAMRCIGASKELVESLRIDFGPHAHCRVKIFMNETAAAAFEDSTSYPAGSIVVKEKQRLGFQIETAIGWRWDGSGSGVGVMIKRKPGFDETNNNWEYCYFEDNTKVEFGKIKSCIECHTKAKKSDFIFGDWAVRDYENDHLNPEFWLPSEQYE